jgi:hypothetical protein
MSQPYSLLPASVLVAGKQKVASALGDGAVMLGLDTGLYYSLNSSCYRIWELLQSPLTLRDLISRLDSVYGAGQARLLEDVRPVIEDMLEHGVLELVPDESVAR